MRTIAIALLVVGSVAGCARTVGPDEFLMYYRQSLPTAGAGRGMGGTYTGRDGGYHYLDVRRRSMMSKPDDLVLFGAFHDQTYRCPEEQLPRDFPEGFLRAYEEGISNESAEASRRYIENYLFIHRR